MLILASDRHNRILKSYMNRLEVILGSLALVSLSADLLGAPVGGAMLVATFSALAIFYYYFAFPIFNQFPLKMAIVKGGETENIEVNRMLARFFGFTIAMVIIGLLFKLMQWPNASAILLIGVVGLAASVLLVFVLFKKSNSKPLLIVLKRLAIFDIVGIVFLTA